MRKTFVAALLLAAPLAQAQEQKGPKIAVIDMGRVSAESLLGKGYSAQLEALKNEIDSEANKKQADLAKMDQATTMDELRAKPSNNLSLGEVADGDADVSLVLAADPGEELIDEVDDAERIAHE